MKSILDRSFRYTPSVETDLRKTFARIRRKQREADTAQEHEALDPATNVLSLDLKKVVNTYPKSV